VDPIGLHDNLLHGWDGFRELILQKPPGCQTFLKLKMLDTGYEDAGLWIHDESA
jgi:hypothetical protein